MEPKEKHISNTNVQETLSNHYSSGYEDNRLTSDRGRLEFERTKELLIQYLPEVPAKILDIGGGTGIYSRWLADIGYEVHLVDIVPLHIEIAKREKNTNLKSIQLGDARKLWWENDVFDVAILFGPLYHLIEYLDREKALMECHRVLKKNGILFCACISRIASLFDGIRSGYIEDSEFIKIVKKDLETGCHINTTNKQEYFTDSFFHNPNEIKNELSNCGFNNIILKGIEGPFWLYRNLNKLWEDEEKKSNILSIIRQIESDETAINLSSHIMGIGYKD